MTKADISEAPAAVTVVLSQEPLLLEDAIARLRAQALTELPDFNRDEIDLAERGAGPLLEAAQTLPMMARVRYVHGRNLERLPAADQAALLDYVGRPAPSTVLVLSGTKLDGRSKWATALRKGAQVVELEAPDARALPRWISERARQMGTAIHPRAAARLGDLTGAELGVLVRNLEQLALYAGPEQTIDVEAVETVVARTQEASIFELTGAMGRREWAMATQRLRQLLIDGEAPLRILAMMVRQIRLLLGAKEATGPASQWAQTLGVRPFVAERLAQEARRFTHKELLRALDEAQACDVALKSSRLSAALVLERLMLHLCVAA